MEYYLMYKSDIQCSIGGMVTPSLPLPLRSVSPYHTWNKHKKQERAHDPQALISSLRGGYSWTHWRKYSRKKTWPPAAAFYMEIWMVTMKVLRLKEWLFWERGTLEFSRGSLHAILKILLLGLAGPVPPNYLIHASKRGKRKNYHPRLKRFVSPQAMFIKNKYMKKCSWY